MKKSRIILFLLTLVALLSIAQAILTNMFSTSGVLMSKINQEIKSYKTENAKMSEKVVTESTLNNIAIKAKELGFSQSKSRFVLTSLPLARRQ